MRTLSDTLGEIFRALWAHKLRSFLTIFGIAWGVGSLLLLVGVGEGFRSGNRREMSTLGEDVMFIFPGRAPSIQGSFVGMRQYYLTQKDYLDIASEAPAVKEVSPVLQRSEHPGRKRLHLHQRPGTRGHAQLQAHPLSAHGHRSLA
jgi:putative ABC transport system permease protein